MKYTPVDPFDPTAPTIAVVMAAGEASRWGGYGGIPKHLVSDVDGEPILHRTTRLLAARDVETWTVARLHSDAAYYQCAGHTYTVSPLDSDLDKFHSARHLWAGRHVVLVYGDCYFTEHAIDTMLAPVDEWTLYCRPNGSAITGSPWGECWGFSLPPHTHEWFFDRLYWLAGNFVLGLLGRVGGWELYRAMSKQPPDIHQMYENYVEIDDFTEDFDYPSDYDMWKAAWLQSMKSASSPTSTEKSKPASWPGS